MAEPGPMVRLERLVKRDAAVARRRSLARRLGGSLIWKYLPVVPAVFTARGETATFRLLVPVEETLSRLRDRTVLSLDSATEVLGGCRVGKGRHLDADCELASDLDVLAEIAGKLRKSPVTGSHESCGEPPGG